MSSYSFVANARFNPLTYDEMIKPLAQYKEVYDTMDKAYSELASQSEAIRKAVEAEPNSQAYKNYMNYSTGLDTAINDFSKGMNTSTRSALMGLRKSYARDIVPITTAVSKRDALAQEQRKLKAQDNTLIFQRDAGSMSIDDFVNNPSADYGQAVSGAMLAKQTQAMAASLAKEARTPEGQAKLKALLPFTYDYVKEYGFSSQAVMSAILREPNASKILTGVVDQVIDASGIKGWGSQQQIQQAYWYANQGLTAAVGETKSQILQDSYSSQLALMKEKARQEAAVAQPQGDIPIGEILPLRDVNDDIKHSKILKHDYEAYQEIGFFDKQNRLTKKGIKALREGETGIVQGVTSPTIGVKSPDVSYHHYNFRNWYQNNIGGYDVKSGKVVTPNTNINKFLKGNISESYDLYHTFKVRVQQTESNGKALLREIKPGEKGIPITHYVKGKGMRDTGDYVKVEDLDKYIVTGVEGYLDNGRNFSANSKVSYQLSLVPKEGQSNVKKAVTIRITPSDFAPKATSTANRAIRKGALLAEILRVGYVPQRESDGSIRVNKRTGQIMFTDKKLNADEKISLTQEVTNSKNEMGYTITQFIRPAEAETTKTHSYIE
jgi:hypothetical protein